MSCWLSRNKLYPVKGFSQCLLALLILFPASNQSFAQTTVQAGSQLLSGETPLSFPETFVVGPQGTLYLLDTDLSSLFTLNSQTGKLNRLCGADKLSSPSDLTVDRRGNLWVLSALRSKMFKLTTQCEVQAEIALQQLPLRIASNSFGEIIVLKGAGKSLFEVYAPDGKLLRAFGQRFEYAEETATSELSDGRIAPDRAGGFFFSFNYPPLIRQYSRNGDLMAEFKPESDVVISPPKISVRKTKNSLAVSSSYQILVLDMTVDGQGRLHLLMSGKDKFPALTEGTPRLRVLAGSGRVLKTAQLEYNFHRLASGNRRLYLLRNRRPVRLDAYAMMPL